MGQTFLEMGDHIHYVRECPFIMVIKDLVNLHWLCLSLDHNAVHFPDAVCTVQFPVGVFADQDAAMILFA